MRMLEARNWDSFAGETLTWQSGVRIRRRPLRRRGGAHSERVEGVSGTGGLRMRRRKRGSAAALKGDVQSGEIGRNHPRSDGGDDGGLSLLNWCRQLSFVSLQQAILDVAESKGADGFREFILRSWVAWTCRNKVLFEPGFRNKVVRSGDLVSCCAEEGMRLLGEGKFLMSNSFPGNDRTKYCMVSKMRLLKFRPHSRMQLWL